MATNRPIFVLGDTHGQHQHLRDLVRAKAPCVLVHLGDIEPELPLEQELSWLPTNTDFYFIHGNHDCDTSRRFDNTFGGQLALNHFSGKVLEVEGVRIAGLGGNFQGSIWMPPAPPAWSRRKDYGKSLSGNQRGRGLLPVRRRAAIFPEDIEKLRRHRADVLVCHEAPSTHRLGFEVIDDLARSLRVKRIFHGHHHVGYHSRIEHGIDVHGVGLRGVTDIDGNVVIPGELDDRCGDRWRRDGRRT